MSPGFQLNDASPSPLNPAVCRFSSTFAAHNRELVLPSVGVYAWKRLYTDGSLMGGEIEHRGNIYGYIYDRSCRLVSRLSTTSNRYHRQTMISQFLNVIAFPNTRQMKQARSYNVNAVKSTLEHSSYYRSVYHFRFINMFDDF